MILGEVAAQFQGPLTTDQYHVRVDDIIRGNHRIKQSEIDSMLSLLKKRVQGIIIDLNYRNNGARWVPRQLTEDMRKERVDIANEILDCYRRKAINFFITL